jgi:hypothetical protein
LTLCGAFLFVGLLTVVAVWIVFILMTDPVVYSPATGHVISEIRDGFQ